MARQMKDSGIEWIGEIPVNWERTSLLNLLRCSISDGPHETPVLIDDGIPFISVDSLNDSEDIDLSVVKKFISDESYQEYNKKTNLEYGDILFSKAATIGKTAILKNEKLMVWSPLAIIKVNTKMCVNKYMYHLLNCYSLIKYISLLGGYNTQINVGMRALEKAVVPFPPFEEQQKIADYLDAKCVEIDTVIAKTKATIEEYKKLKQSIITEAVTKGIRGDRPMKDSGIEWIGDIPDNWKCPKLKTFSEIISKGTTPKDINILQDETYSVRYLKSENIVDNELLEVPSFFITQETHKNELSRSQLQINDILFVIAGASIGKVAIMKAQLLPSNTNQAISFIRVKEQYQYCQKYLWYFLQCNHIKTYINLYSVQSAQPNISMENLGNIRIIFPDCKTEICEIEEYLDAKCSEMDKLIAKKEQVIAELEGYKKSLIYEYVTGKKEVY